MTRENQTKLIGGFLIAAGIVTFLLSTKKGKKVVHQISDQISGYSENATLNFTEKKGEIKNKVADKVFDIASKNRNSIAWISGYIAPYILRSLVRKKL